MKRVLFLLGMLMPVMANAAGYMCDSKQYTSCAPDYYLAIYNGGEWEYEPSPTPGNSCAPCPDGYTCAGGVDAPTPDVKCDAGQYLDNSGNCTPCGSVNYYCPGDDIRHACPAATNANIGNVALPEGTPADSVLTSGGNRGSSSTTSFTSIEQCSMTAYYANHMGRFFVWVSYNATTEKYDVLKSTSITWNKANPGYYVYQHGAKCDGSTYYKIAAECLPGAYCPGWNSIACGTNPPYPDENGLYVCPDNSYSDDGASECTPCPVGWGNQGDNLSDHAGASSCNIRICPAGQYLLPDGVTCDLCELGYYCPGDNEMYVCGGTAGVPLYADEPGLSECKECPPLADEYMDGLLYYWYWIAAADDPAAFVHTTRDSCRAEWTRSMPHGSAIFSCSYGTSGYTATGESDIKCMASSVECDAGYYVVAPGWGDNINKWWGPSYTYMMKTDFCQPVGAGYYSPADSPLRTACPDGTSTHGTTSTSSDDCAALCPVGMAEFHAGDLTYSLWQDKPTPVAINIGYDTQVCYVGLQSGTNADGPALYINVGATTYHAVN